MWEFICLEIRHLNFLKFYLSSIIDLEDFGFKLKVNDQYFCVFFHEKILNKKKKQYKTFVLHIYFNRGHLSEKGD